MLRSYPVLSRMLGIALPCVVLAGFMLPAQERIEVDVPRKAPMSDAELSQALIGSWRIVDAHRDGKPSDLHFTCVTLKHITPTQFTWLSYKPEDRQVFRSMGGSWEVRDGKYLETARYGMAEGFRENSFGRVMDIACEIDKNTFTQVIIGRDGSQFVEVWERVQPGEEADQIPNRR